MEFSDFISGGANIGKSVDVTRLTNAELAAAAKALGVIFSATLARPEEYENLVPQTVVLADLILEVSRRGRKSQSMTGVNRVFFENPVLRVAPGSIVKAETDEKGVTKTTPIQDFGVGYHSNTLAESVSFAAAGAITMKTYGHKSAIVATNVPMPAIVQNAHLRGTNVAMKAMANALVTNNDVYVQRERVAAILASKGGIIPVNALFASVQPGNGIPVKQAPESLRKAYTSLGITGTSHYSPCPAPKYTGSKVSLEKAIFYRHSARQVRGEDRGGVSPLCKPSYLGEVPRHLQDVLTNVFAVSMIFRYVLPKHTEYVLDVTGYDLSLDARVFLATMHRVYDPQSEKALSPSEVGFTYVKGSNHLAIIRSKGAESIVTTNAVRDPIGMDAEIKRVVDFMERYKGFVICDIFSYPSLYTHSKLVVLPHPIGHRCRVFIALKKMVEYEGVSPEDMGGYFSFCNYYRTMYPFHRKAMWLNSSVFFTEIPALIITRRVMERTKIMGTQDLEIVFDEDQGCAALAKDYETAILSTPIVQVQSPKVIVESAADTGVLDFSALPSPTTDAGPPVSLFDLSEMESLYCSDISDGVGKKT